MSSGYTPFFHEEDARVVKLIIHGKFEFHSPFWDPVSSAAKDVISRMLTTDPDKRPSADELLAHPWFRYSPLCVVTGGKGRRHLGNV